MAFTTASPRYNKRWVVKAAFALMFVSIAAFVWWHPWKPRMIRDSGPAHLGLVLPASAKDINVSLPGWRGHISLWEFSCSEPEFLTWMEGQKAMHAGLTEEKMTGVGVTDLAGENPAVREVREGRSFNWHSGHEAWNYVYDRDRQRVYVMHVK